MPRSSVASPVGSFRRGGGQRRWKARVLVSLERRKHPRVRVEVPSRLRVAGADHVGSVKDMCRDAVLVETDRSWPVETPVVLEMTLPDTDGAVAVTGRVVREIRSDGGPSAVAVLFDDPDPMTLLKIDLFLELHGQTAERP
jgi:hypothetical protein